MRLTLRLPTLLLLLAAACTFTWAVVRLVYQDPAPSPNLPQSARISAAPPIIPSGSNESENIEIYRRVSPAVVNITSTTLSFDFFFNAIPEQGSGSGSIIDAQGHILTNYHVVEDARLLEVTLLDDKRKFKANQRGLWAARGDFMKQNPMKRTPLLVLARHVEHVAKTIGWRHAGLG